MTILEAISKNTVLDKFGEYAWLVYDLEEAGLSEFSEKFSIYRKSFAVMNGNFLFKAVYIIIDELKKNPDLKNSLFERTFFKNVGLALAMYSFISANKLLNSLPENAKAILHSFLRIRTYNDLLEWSEKVVENDDIYTKITVKIISNKVPLLYSDSKVSIFKINNSTTIKIIFPDRDYPFYIDDYMDGYAVITKDKRYPFKIIKTEELERQGLTKYLKFDKQDLFNEVLKNIRKEIHSKEILDRIKHYYSDEAELAVDIKIYYQTFEYLKNSDYDQKVIDKMFELLITSDDRLIQQAIGYYYVERIPRSLMLYLLKNANSALINEYLEKQKLKSATKKTYTSVEYYIQRFQIPEVVLDVLKNSDNSLLNLFNNFDEKHENVTKYLLEDVLTSSPLYKNTELLSYGLLEKEERNTLTSEVLPLLYGYTKLYERVKGIMNLMFFKHYYHSFIRDFVEDFKSTKYYYEIKDLAKEYIISVPEIKFYIENRERIYNELSTVYDKIGMLKTTDKRPFALIKLMLSENFSILENENISKILNPLMIPAVNNYEKYYKALANKLPVNIYKQRFLSEIDRYMSYNLKNFRLAYMFDHIFYRAVLENLIQNADTPNNNFADKAKEFDSLITNIRYAL